MKNKISSNFKEYPKVCQSDFSDIAFLQSMGCKGRFTNGIAEIELPNGETAVYLSYSKEGNKMVSFGLMTGGVWEDNFSVQGYKVEKSPFYPFFGSPKMIKQIPEEDKKSIESQLRKNFSGKNIGRIEFENW